MRTTLRKGETQKIVVRRHWIVFAAPVAAIAGMIGLLYVIQQRQWSELLEVALLFSLGALCWLAYVYLDWKTNIWAVTSERVIDEWGIISRNAKESPLDRINNVSYTQSILGRILGFGDVEIQTAASEGATVNRMVSTPKLLQETIMNAKSEHGKSPINKDEVTEMGDERECPYCAERIKTRAKVCKHCGKDIATSNDPPVIENPESPPDTKKPDENVKWARFK